MATALERVLCIEDEPDILEVVTLALEVAGGYAVSGFLNPREAVDRAPEIAADLVLLDVMMPELDGPATFRALRAQPATATVPIVFMTAKTQPSEIERLECLGAAGILHKPFDPMRLAGDVADAWQRHISSHGGV